MSVRHAVYFTPSPSSDLGRFGAGILGYDCFNAIDVPLLRLGGVGSDVHRRATEEPRRYGFHATIVAPFALKGDTEDSFVEAVGAFADKAAPVELGRLVLTVMGGFLALVPADKNPAVEALAADCVQAFSDFRAPLSSADRERRVAGGLTARQIELLDVWGYPYVFDEYRFHMTLTNKLEPVPGQRIQQAVTDAMRDLSNEDLTIDALSVMRQDDRAGRFHVLRRCRLRG